MYMSLNLNVVICYDELVERKNGFLEDRFALPCQEAEVNDSNFFFSNFNGPVVGCMQL